jgi:hypothetical protein
MDRIVVRKWKGQPGDEFRHIKRGIPHFVERISFYRLQMISEGSIVLVPNAKFVASLNSPSSPELREEPLLGLGLAAHELAFPGHWSAVLGESFSVYTIDKLVHDNGGTPSQFRCRLLSTTL